MPVAFVVVALSVVVPLMRSTVTPARPFSPASMAPLAFVSVQTSPLTAAGWNNPAFTLLSTWPEIKVTASVQASAKVDKVTVTSASQAKVVYTILFAGTPALSNVSGVAVLENGMWKVGDVSFCGLLTLENNNKPMAVCKSVA